MMMTKETKTERAYTRAHVLWHQVYSTQTWMFRNKLANIYANVDDDNNSPDIEIIMKAET